MKYKINIDYKQENFILFCMDTTNKVIYKDMIPIQPLVLTDFYKQGHYKMYPRNTRKVVSNLTARKSRINGINKVVFFGLQYFIIE